MNQANKQDVAVALVTGSARRIGAAIVKALHGIGYKVVIHCRESLSDAHALALDLNQQRSNSALVLQREFINQPAAAELINASIAWAGRMDLLVNNASAFIRSEGCLFNEEDWDHLFSLNVKIPFLLSVAARPFLMKQEGAIINLTDIHAEKPLKGYAVYCQTKAALEMQTKALAREFAPEIRVNAVAPGAIVWPEQANQLNNEHKQEIINRTPLKRHGHPDYIAQAVVSLAQNPFISGQIIKVDGGRSLVG